MRGLLAVAEAINRNASKWSEERIAVSGPVRLGQKRCRGIQTKLPHQWTREVWLEKAGD